MAAALADPATRAWALAPTAVDNEPAKVRSGDPYRLAHDGQLGGPTPLWAVVIRPHPQLLALDLDGCADLTLPALLDAAADTGTDVIVVVASGRANHAHLWLAPPTPHARSYVLGVAHYLRSTHRLSAKAIDDRTGLTIRVPGSASLKSGARAAALRHPETGRPITAHAVLERLADAGIATDRSPVAGTPADTTPDRAARQHAPATPPPTAQDPAARPLSDAALRDAHNQPLSAQSPRAWRKRVPFTAQDWAVLSDTTSSDRSAAATAAAWVLWRHGIRGASAALWWYRHLPAFSKFRDRDRRSATSGWTACRQHWSSIKRRAYDYRPAMSAADSELLAEVTQEISWWADTPLLHAAATAVITERFSDGYGLTGRPIARRDIQTWLHLSDGVAGAVLNEMVARGLLERTDWQPGMPRVAARYTLSLPGSSFRGDRAHDLTSPTRTHLHPLWASLSHIHRTIWELLTSPHTTAALAQTLHLPVGDASYGLLRVLHQLTDLGLVTAVGGRKHRSWQVNPAVSLDAAADACGASDRARQLATRINAERAAWHAESTDESQRTRRGLEVLRSRMRHMLDADTESGPETDAEQRRWQRTGSHTVGVPATSHPRAYARLPPQAAPTGLLTHDIGAQQPPDAPPVRASCRDRGPAASDGRNGLSGPTSSGMRASTSARVRRLLPPPRAGDRGASVNERTVPPNP